MGQHKKLQKLHKFLFSSLTGLKKTKHENKTSLTQFKDISNINSHCWRIWKNLHIPAWYGGSRGVHRERGQHTSYCIVSIHLYITSCSAYRSKAYPVRETQREESSLERSKRGTVMKISNSRDLFSLPNNPD